jgi:hypothetical protein
MTKFNIAHHGESLLKGRFSTVDLRVPTSLDQPLIIVKILFTFFTKYVTLMRRYTVLSLPPQLVLPESILTPRRAPFLSKLPYYKCVIRFKVLIFRDEQNTLAYFAVASTAMGEGLATQIAGTLTTMTCSGNTNGTGRISTLDLLAPTCSELLLCTNKLF